MADPPASSDPGPAPAAPAPGAPKKKPVGLIWAGVIVLALSFVIGVLSVIVIVQGAGGLTGEDFAVPGSAAVELETGTYAVWVSNGLPYGNARTRAEVSVTGPSGPVDVRRPALGMYLNQGSSEYVARGEFDVTTAGTYEVQVESEDAELARVSPPLQAGRLAAGIIGVTLSGLVFLIGLVLFIIGIVVRARAGRPPGPAHTPPAGYGPPPGYGPPTGYPSPAPGYGPPPAYPPPAYPPPGPSAEPPPPTGAPVEPPPGAWRPPGDERS